MIFLHDPELPFHKILVKEAGFTLGVIRRNLKTGQYEFYESETNSPSPLFRAGRLEIIKKWLAARYFVLE